MDKRVYTPQKCILEDLKDVCGIYQIRNIINNNIYVGSSSNLRKRILTHINKLRKNIHDNAHLQKAYNKYGEENFVFEIVEFCSKEEQYKIEQYWLDQFFGKEFCYNENPKATHLGFTEEIRQRMSENHTDVSGVNNYFYGKHFTGEQNHFYGKHHTEESRKIMSEKSHMSKKVVKLIDNTVYRTMKECCLQNNISESCLRAHCHNKLKKTPQKFMFYQDWCDQQSKLCVNSQ
jgi:group I intron endonuclease